VKTVDGKKDGGRTKTDQENNYSQETAVGHDVLQHHLQQKKNITTNTATCKLRGK
jgi:hypothetical protein